MVLDFLSATMSDTLTVLIQVETFLASLMLTGFIFTSLGHLVLPVVFVFLFQCRQHTGKKYVRIRFYCKMDGLGLKRGRGRKGKMGACLAALPVGYFCHIDNRFGCYCSWL
jgi:hypothetical protein